MLSNDLVPAGQTDAFVEVVDVNVGNGAQMNPGLKHLMKSRKNFV